MYATTKDASLFTEFVAVREDVMLTEYLNMAVSLGLISNLDIDLAVAKQSSHTRNAQGLNAPCVEDEIEK